MSLAYLQELLPRLVRENGDRVTSTDIDRAIASAVLQYSVDAPRTVVREHHWEAAGHFCSTVPEGLTEDSTILKAEYPLGLTPPDLVGVLQHVTDGPLGLMCETALPFDAVVRLTFTSPHVVVGGQTPQDTIPLRHRDAVAHYAAHLLCRELAALYSGERESSIGADSSSTESRARNYSARSREYRAAYYAAVGIADPLASGAATGSASSSAGQAVSWGRRARPFFRTN